MLHIERGGCGGQTLTEGRAKPQMPRSLPASDKVLLEESISQASASSEDFDPKSTFFCPLMHKENWVVQLKDINSIRCIGTMRGRSRHYAERGGELQRVDDRVSRRGLQGDPC